MSSAQTFVIPDPGPELQAIKTELASIRELLEKVVLSPKPEWITVHDYAEQLGKTVRTVMRMIEAGKIEGKKVGSVWMVKP